MKRSGKILLEGTIEEFKKHCKGADNREYLLINTKEIKKDGTYAIYLQDINNLRIIPISIKGKRIKIANEEKYLTFIALSSGSFTFTGVSSGSDCIISYSTDEGESWSPPSKNVSITVNEGDKVLWKGEMSPVTPYGPPLSGGIGHFGGSALFKAKGNLKSLLYGDNFIGKTLESKSYAFSYLFYLSNIVSANDLSMDKTLSDHCYYYMFYGCTYLTVAPKLPATTLTLCCYYSMFSGCTSLTTPPKLPATTLAGECYLNMFNNCASLTTPPSLPATTLANYCYSYMFAGCSSLTKAPELPATTMVSNCYNSMFKYCTSLIIAPQLPATTLAGDCYYYMFSGCTSLTTAPELNATVLTSNCYNCMFLNCSSLNYIKMLAIDISATYCLSSWVSGVANRGTFVKATRMTTLPTGNNGIPSGWTVEDFPRNYLKFVAKSQGSFDFSSTIASNMILYSTDNGNTWSTPSPLISINVNVGDLIMWKGEMTPTQNGIGSFNNSTAAFDIEGNIMSLLYGDNFELQTYLKGDSSTFKYLFSKTKVNSAKNLALPSTILVESCYESMFQECTELVKAPHLPAATLTASCYKNMFKDCTSLNYIEMVATDISASYCLLNWVNNVAEIGVLIIDENQTDIPIGDSGVPLGWTSYSMLSYYSQKYLTLVAKDSGAFNFKGTSSNMILYSTNNGETWSEPSNDVTVNVNKDDSVLWKGEMTPSSNNLGIGYFTDSTAGFNVEGNIMSLLYGDNFIGLTDLTDKNYVFWKLFQKSFCINAGNLILPATTLSNYCYSWMFYNCSILETTPLLPALTLMNGCYVSMFGNCTNLTVAPKLPATLLASSCYSAMFQNAALIVAPQLPATTLAAQCYQTMFIGCKSLVEAPSLPAETLASNCYSSMFSSCTGLVAAPQLPATTLAPYCYESMFKDCVSLTTAPTLPANTLEQRSYYSMFSGCTSLTTAPLINATTLGNECCTNMFLGCTSLESAPSILPATTLALKCYYSMFLGCTSLMQAPELPATTLASECYYSMFSSCTSLTTPPELPATTLANNCYENMFRNCTSLNTTPLLPATVLKNGCYSLMFSGTNVLPDCTNIDFTSQTVVASGGLKGLFKDTKVTDNDLMNILPINPQTNHYWLPVTTLTIECYYQMFGDCQYLITAPELPATTLANKCYHYMFSGCTSLTTAPSVLPATTLASYCYSFMFKGCTSLTAAPALPATTLAQYCYLYMFQDCTSLTTSPELTATTLVNYCYYYMFYGCRNLNHIKMLATSTSASRCLSYWVSSVAPTGTFVKHPSMTSLPRGASGIPSNWTVEDAVEIVEDATE